MVIKLQRLLMSQKKQTITISFSKRKQNNNNPTKQILHLINSLNPRLQKIQGVRNIENATMRMQWAPPVTDVARN